MSTGSGWIVNGVLFLALVGGTAFGTRSMVTSAVTRLESGEGGAAQPATAAGAPPTEASAAPGKAAPPTAAHAEVEYCSEQLKTVLRRVLTACGLIGAGRRGCQPGELRNVAQITDADFNALFHPLSGRGGLVLFDLGKEELDAGAKKLIEDLWADRRGASYFFVVGRASTDGKTETNRALSHRRVNSVLFHVQEQFADPELEKEVGLLWLGEEYAQLGKEFCAWQRSRPEAECTEEVLNRSAILSWIDCRL